jgi:hypothetical protein
MAKRGRKPKPGLRTRSGQLSRRPRAQPDRDDGIVASQPHRAPFAKLLGEQAARSQAAASALGRLRLIGEAEERHGLIVVRKRLEAMGHVACGVTGEPLGIGERQYWAGLKYADAVGRERWVRAAPKDKPSAVAFMVARGLDLSGRELSDAAARHYVQQFEESRAVLMAAACSEDMRRVLRSLRDRVERLRSGAVKQDADDLMRLLRGLGALANPQAAASIKRAVDLVVIDDRDPDAATLALLRRGLDALADFHFGADAQRGIGGKPVDDAGWKARHRSFAG